MSLIRVRRDRKEETGLGAKRAKSVASLVALLAFVLAVIWYLGTLS